jgi:L-asparagine oxygenase
MLEELAQSGFVLLRDLRPLVSTTEVAGGLGSVVRLEDLLPSSGIPTVQSLKPRDHGVGGNQYSGNYGLGAFPLHTDLAHWAIPPRYFILRCIVPAEDVSTKVLPWSALAPSLGPIDMRRAVFTGRRQRIGNSGLVRALMDVNGAELRRWDGLFLVPLNRLAHDFARFMNQPGWTESATEIRFQNPGDTLVIDNWRVLHGRSPVPPRSAGRLIERAYLSEVAK